MSLGVAWSAKGHGEETSETMMEEAPDIYRFVPEQPLVARPGTVWRSNGGATNLLARIVVRETGMPIDAFATANLFAPWGSRTPSG